MQCPMCGGPLSLRELDPLACDPVHEVHPALLKEAAAIRVTSAFWGAIEALESRVDILRSLDLGRTEQARIAEEDAKILRRLALSTSLVAEPDDDSAATTEHTATVRPLRSPSELHPERGGPTDPDG